MFGWRFKMNIRKKFIFLCMFLSMILSIESISAMPVEDISENQAGSLSENIPEATEDISDALENVSENMAEILSENEMDEPEMENTVSQEDCIQEDCIQEDYIPVDDADAVSENAEENASEASKEKDFVFHGFLGVEENDYWLTSVNQHGLSVMFILQNNTDVELNGTVASGDDKIVVIDDANKNFTLRPNGSDMFSIDFSTKRAGSTSITVAIKGEKHSFRVNVTPAEVEITNIAQTAYKTLKLSWKKSDGCSGYYIERSAAGKEDYSVIKTVKGENNTTATLKAPEEKKYAYRVVGFITDDGGIYRGKKGNSQIYTVKRIDTPITSVKRSGSSSLKITWKRLNAATSYVLYRSTKENGNYKKVYTAKKGTVTSYTQKVRKGVTYYYKLVTVTALGTSKASPSVSQFIPQSSKKKAKKVKIPQQYSDAFYYYESGGRMYIVRKTKNLKIYTMTSNMKIKSQKTVKLGQYDMWGGFYHGLDGKFYVAVGYSNLKESGTKTVIKVMQFGSNWKKQKTAVIKGSVANVFKGIYIPFASGACRMDMQGNTLYMHTSRTMFALEDGVHHQSNISFAIDTNTMKANVSNDSYVSHSFDQYVRFKDGNLYLLDHGDAYPRAIYLTMVENFGSSDVLENGYEIFQFKGKQGDNYTGCKIGGMEVGGRNVLTTGISKPHGYKVKGVTGFKSSYADNLFLTVTNRETGKNTVKWLTKNNPKSSKVRLNAAKMLKLSDDRFAIICSQTKGIRSSVQYIVVDGNGKKVYTKSYANMNLDNEQQPILLNGKILWLESGTLYSIPAVY